MPVVIRPHREVALLLALLGAVLAWELTGLDLPVAAALGGAMGFPARDSLWARTLGHEGVRALEAALWLGLAVNAFWRSPAPSGPARIERRMALGVGVAVLLLVPALKTFSHTSCPWDLQGFGGTVPWVSHWDWTQRDGGPGHCFPSGHTAGVAALAVWAWLWQRRWVWGAWAALLAFASLAQWARGAHFVSHSLWAAWLGLASSWVLLRAAQAGWRIRVRRAAASGMPTPTPG